MPRTHRGDASTLRRPRPALPQVLLPLKFLFLPILIPYWVTKWLITSVLWLFLWPIFLPWRIFTWIV